jgi:photosystem II stability/assembly factor-like uncharacterized protein
MRKPPASRFSILLASAATLVASLSVAQEAWHPQGLQGQAIHALGVTPADTNVVYAGTDLGVYRSDNAGAAWQLASGGLPVTPVRALAVHPDNPLTLYAGTDTGLFRSDDGGASWIPRGNGLEGTAVLVLAIDPRRGNVLYAATDRMGPLQVFRTGDGGQLWQAITIQGPGYGTPTFGLIEDIEIRATDSRVHIGWHEIVFYSDNDGGVWPKYNDLNLEVENLLVDPFNPDTLYASVQNGGVARSAPSFNWTFATGINTLTVVDLAADPSLSGTIFAAAPSSGVYRSTNGGTSFSATPAIPSPARVLIFAPGRSRLYAGTDNGVYRLGQAEPLSGPRDAPAPVDRTRTPGQISPRG